MGEEYCPKIKLLEIEFQGEGPKIGGWKFLGTLDHYSLPGSIIVNTVPGEKIPESFYKSDASCDHCGKIRRRTETFVLQEEKTGDYKRVGRQCVRDFIGYDPNQVLRFLTVIRNFTTSFDEQDWFGGGSGRANYTFNTKRALADTAAIIYVNGWVPRSKGGFDQMPTADFLMNLYFPPKGDAKRHWNEWVERLDLKNEKWEKEAEGAINWLREQKSDNEYMHNLRAIDTAGSVPPRLFGYWCSLMATYQKAQERLRLAEQQKHTNEYVGEIKQRLDFKVNVVSIHSHDGYYGTTYRHKFIDEEGHTLIWWANTDSKMAPGDTCKIKGTIKKHEEYEGWKQTLLSRVKLIELIKLENE